MNLLLGDCVEQLKLLDENSVDSVVCDPPCELGFMGKHWDASGIAYSVDLWKEVERVLKPGGHLLAFGGTRTYHRMACAIEDAGFEIRDQLQWLYGSGFPKSYNIGKGVDKKLGNEREIICKTNSPKFPSGDCISGRLKDVERIMYENSKGNSEWEGWGSALKPANEPICLARKHLSEKNLVENVLKWGVGGLNIDASRINTNGEKVDIHHTKGASMFFQGNYKNVNRFNSIQGRFPANVLLDETASKMLDEQAPNKGAFAPVKSGQKGFGGVIYGKYNSAGDDGKTFYSDGLGGASRFFYVAKASKRERNEGCESLELKSTGHGNLQNSKGMERFDTYNNNNHPTVKPVKLMEYLVRLVTPKGGVVLDPFMGSGTTGIACRNLGFDFIGIEKEKDYYEIAKVRIGNQQTLKELKEEGGKK